MPALVFNCHYNGLGLIHSLGRQGIKVYALDSTRSIGTYSKYAEFRKVPDPLIDVDGFINQLMEYEFDKGIRPLLLPTNDHWAQAISYHAELLSQKYTLCTPDKEVISLLLDKYRFSIWAEEKGYTVPRVYSPEVLIKDGFEIEFPIAVKAKSRRSISMSGDKNDQKRDADSFRFIICSNKNELFETLRQAKTLGIDCYCQQVVNGDSSCMRTIGIYASKGEVIGLLYGRKIRGFPPTYGDCIVGEAMPVPEWAEELAIKFAAETNYTGIAEIELMRDSVSGVYYLIEVNPRSWSWVGVGASAGVDFAWLAYEDLVLGKKIQLHKSCSDGERIRYIKVLEDLPNVIAWNRLAGFSNWSLSPVKWMKEFRTQKNVMAEFPNDDLLIGIVSLINAVRRNLSKTYKKFRGHRIV